MGTSDEITADELVGWMRDAAGRLTDLVADLSDEQLIGPPLEIVNPLLWEIGHVMWFSGELRAARRARRAADHRARRCDLGPG